MDKTVNKKRDRQQQVITTLKRYGPDYYKDIAKRSRGGGFNDPEVARRAAIRMHELRRLKKEEQQRESDTSTNTEAS